MPESAAAAFDGRELAVQDRRPWPSTAPPQPHWIGGRGLRRPLPDPPRSGRVLSPQGRFIFCPSDTPFMQTDSQQATSPHGEAGWGRSRPRLPNQKTTSRAKPVRASHLTSRGGRVGSFEAEATDHGGGGKQPSASQAGLSSQQGISHVMQPGKTPQVEQQTNPGRQVELRPPP